MNSLNGGDWGSTQVPWPPNVYWSLRKSNSKLLKQRIWIERKGGGKFCLELGQEVLVKYVLQSIPTYTMSVFKLPMGLCEDVQSTVVNLWCSGDVGKEVFVGVFGRNYAF